MSRKLLVFLLSELRTVRLVCPSPGCGTVTEMSVDRLAQTYAGDPHCRHCGTTYNLGGGSNNLLARLGQAIAAIQAQANGAPVELVFPDDGPSA